MPNRPAGLCVKNKGQTESSAYPVSPRKSHKPHKKHKQNRPAGLCVKAKEKHAAHTLFYHARYTNHVKTKAKWTGRSKRNNNRDFFAENHVKTWAKSIGRMRKNKGPKNAARTLFYHARCANHVKINAKLTPPQETIKKPGF